MNYIYTIGTQFNRKERAMNLFAYGSLMCADILYKITACSLSYSPATLANYKRCGVRDETYPGLVEQQGSSVTGVVYFSVPEDAWLRLDIFEGEMYSRSLVCVSCDDKTSVDAATYIIRPQFRHRLSSNDWNFQEFLQFGRKRFEAEYSGFDKLGNAQ